MKDTLYIASQVFKDLQTPDSEWHTKDFVSLVGTVVGAFLAYGAAILLQRRQRKHDSKYAVFMALFGERNITGNSPDFTLKLNQVPIVFNKNKKVTYAYEVFIKAHKMKPFDHNVVFEALHILIREIAKDLKYEDIDFKVIMNSFYPKNVEDASTVRSIKTHYFLKDNLENYLNDVMGDQNDGDSNTRPG